MDWIVKREVRKNLSQNDSICQVYSLTTAARYLTGFVSRVIFRRFYDLVFSTFVFRGG
jgi:ssDNA-specific exonuclease RecJ